jgi:hypothetical protein
VDVDARLWTARGPLADARLRGDARAHGYEATREAAMAAFPRAGGGRVRFDRRRGRRLASRKGSASNNCNPRGLIVTHAIPAESLCRVRQAIRAQA